MHSFKQFPDSFTPDTVLLLESVGLRCVEELAVTPACLLQQKLAEYIHAHRLSLEVQFAEILGTPCAPPVHIDMFLHAVQTEAVRLLARMRR